MTNDGSEKKRAGQKARLQSFLQKIPLFSDFPPITLRKLLTVCSKVAVDEGQYLCKKGEDSNAMYVLLSGKLAVKLDGPAPVATIDPIDSIGEMGVFTGEPRTANVQAIKKSALLVLRRYDLNAFIRKDTDFGVRIMSKVIKILAERINADNIKMRDYQKYIISAEENK